MPVRQETNARFLVQVSIKSQNERKSKRKLLEQKKVLSEDPGGHQVWGQVGYSMATDGSCIE